MLRYTAGMDTAVKTRPAKQNTINERQDLRAWIAQLRAFGELQDISGAEIKRQQVSGDGIEGEPKHVRT